jgi:hypothetical protein
VFNYVEQQRPRKYIVKSKSKSKSKSRQRKKRSLSGETLDLNGEDKEKKGDKSRSSSGSTINSDNTPADNHVKKTSISIFVKNSKSHKRKIFTSNHT